MNPAVLASTCPHLGMRDDPGAYYSYASPGNCCYRCRRPATPLLDHQEAYCLKDTHKDCPVYLQAESEAFPSQLRAEEAAHWARAASIGLVLAIAVGLAALAFGAFQFFPQVFGLPPAIPLASATPVVIEPSVTAVPPTGSPTPTSSHVPLWTPTGSRAPTKTPTNTPTSTPTNTPTHTPTNTPTNTPTKTPTNTPTKTPTKTPTNTPINTPTSTALPLRHPLEVPFEVNGHKLVMHWVSSGETFEIIDAKYETTAEVIRALNYVKMPSLWANTVIVIAPGLKIVDPSLPSFRVFQVVEPAVKIDDVALQFNVTATLLRAYNGCTDNCPLAPGDWVLIPVSSH